MKSGYIHRLAIVESDRVGPGTRVWPFAHIMPGAIVGSDCNVGEGSFIESGVVVGDRVTIKNHSLIWEGVTIQDDVFVGPNVVFTNDLRPRVRYPTPREAWSATIVEEGATIGANCTILCGIRVGRNAMVGAGSVVTRSVPAHALVYGNPAVWRGWVCECGDVLSESLRCGCGREFQIVDAGLQAKNSAGPRTATAARRRRVGGGVTPE